MSESQEYKPKIEYYKLIPNDGNVVADFIEKFLVEFPEAKIKIEKFSSNSITRESADVDLGEFVEECRKSEPLGSSVKAEKTLLQKNILQFATSEIMINGVKHIIWIDIDDTDENREKVNKLL